MIVMPILPALHVWIRMVFCLRFVCIVVACVDAHKHVKVQIPDLLCYLASYPLLVLLLSIELKPNLLMSSFISIPPLKVPVEVDCNEDSSILPFKKKGASRVELFTNRDWLNILQIIICIGIKSGRMFFFSISVFQMTPLKSWIRHDIADHFLTNADHCIYLVRDENQKVEKPT